MERKSNEPTMPPGPADAAAAAAPHCPEADTCSDDGWGFDYYGFGEEREVPLNDCVAATDDDDDDDGARPPSSAAASAGASPAAVPVRDRIKRMNRVGSCAAVVGGSGGDVQVGRCDSYALFRGSGTGVDGPVGRAAEAVRGMHLDDDDDDDEFAELAGEGVTAKNLRRHGSDFLLSADGETAVPVIPVGGHGGDVQIGRKDSYSLFRGDSCGPNGFETAARAVRDEEEKKDGGEKAEGGSAPLEF